MLLCWSAKGGSGTTVVTAALSLMLSRARSTIIADLCGDIPAALGMPEPCGPGLADWLASPDADVEALKRLAVGATVDLRVIPLGATPMPAAPRWSELLEALDLLGEEVVIDAGSGEPPAELASSADQSILVIRPCYLAMRRAVALAATPSGVVLVSEPGRSLRASDVERAVGAPVIAEVPFDPAVSRAVDAGLLASRLPRSLATSLRNAT
jgi:MinD-like ATPase involved in chromosome partitioning or flagellar assembly